MDFIEFNKKAQSKKRENQLFYKKLNNRPLKNLDQIIHQEHEKVFEQINCLTCANCCKTTSPIFYQSDIERAAKATKMRSGAFIDKYLKIDEDNDYVLKQSPCSFLNQDNYCVIYKDRPKACRDYPHTNRKKMQQILSLTYQNTLVCPAVLEITERIKKKLGVQ